MAPLGVEDAGHRFLAPGYRRHAQLHRVKVQHHIQRPPTSLLLNERAHRYPLARLAPSVLPPTRHLGAARHGRLLAEQLLLSCPTSSAVMRSARTLGRIRLYVPGELPLLSLSLPARPTLYASPHNPGALAVAKDLARGMAGDVDVTSDAAAIAPRGSKRAAATHFLLYLNNRTYLGEECEALAEQLRAVRAEGSTVKLVMVHENDDARGGWHAGSKRPLLPFTRQRLCRRCIGRACSAPPLGAAPWPSCQCGVGRKRALPPPTQVPLQHLL